MNSLWLCVDAEQPKSHRPSGRGSRAKARAVQPPVFGIFTDHPANIARRIPRPLTPFVPAPDDEVAPRKLPVWEVDSLPACDSPPADMAFDFASPAYNDVSCISIF
jgi:hypothetical protein